MTVYDVVCTLGGILSSIFLTSTSLQIRSNPRNSNTEESDAFLYTGETQSRDEYFDIIQPVARPHAPLLSNWNRMLLILAFVWAFSLVFARTLVFALVKYFLNLRNRQQMTTQSNNNGSNHIINNNQRQLNHLQAN